GAGRLGEAEHFYRRILEVVRTDLDARHMIGVLRLQQDRAAEALQILAPLLTEVPRHADIRTHHGLGLQALGRGDEALADFDRALALKPDNALTLLCRGNLLLDAARPDEALASYDR